ncbi:MAG: sulfate adenylyltransferase [Campylobacterota bacterium]|nr:sulfate adenylyltransferase [Campylobacterota bacterium]
MASSKRNRTLFIDSEAVSALSLVKAGLLKPVDRLLNQKEAAEVLKTGLLDGSTFPFPFLLAPSGKRNKEVLKTAHSGETLDLITHAGEVVGELLVDEVFPINIQERLRQIYGSDDRSHPGVASTSKRLGSYSVSGEYSIDTTKLEATKQFILDAKARINAQHTTAIMMAVNPLHRAHERLIRQTLESTDLIVLFLLKPYQNSGLPYELREHTLKHFINNFLPQNRVIIVTLENSYLFAGSNEVIIDAIVAGNYGCDQLMIGQNHAGVGMYYDHNANKSVIDRLQGINININIASEYVYCDQCTTLVSTKTCPHGRHHHISYHSDAILELIKTGVIPPAVLMRKEISATILTHLFPGRFKNIEKLYNAIMPVQGLIEEHSEADFYSELMKLYQTTSLT